MKLKGKKKKEEGERRKKKVPIAGLKPMTFQVATHIHDIMYYVLDSNIASLG